jgi:hypothetical protein
MTRKNSAKPGKLATLTESARELGLDTATVKRAAELGQLRTVELGSRRYVRRCDLAKLVGEGE